MKRENDWFIGSLGQSSKSLWIPIYRGCPTYGTHRTAGQDAPLPGVVVVCGASPRGSRDRGCPAYRVGIERATTNSGACAKTEDLNSPSRTAFLVDIG